MNFERLYRALSAILTARTGGTVTVRGKYEEGKEH